MIQHKADPELRCLFDTVAARIAFEFGVTRDSMYRHKREHLPTLARHAAWHVLANAGVHHYDIAKEYQRDRSSVSHALKKPPPEAGNYGCAGVTCEMIAAAVNAIHELPFGWRVEDDTKMARTSQARREYAYACRELTPHSFPSIARAVNRSGHSAIHSSCLKYIEQTDEMVRREMVVRVARWVMDQYPVTVAQSYKSKDKSCGFVRVDVQDAEGWEYETQAERQEWRKAYKDASRRALRKALAEQQGRTT